MVDHQLRGQQVNLMADDLVVHGLGEVGDRTRILVVELAGQWRRRIHSFQDEPDGNHSGPRTSDEHLLSLQQVSPGERHFFHPTSTGAQDLDDPLPRDARQDAAELRRVDDVIDDREQVAARGLGDVAVQIVLQNFDGSEASSCLLPLVAVVVARPLGGREPSAVITAAELVWTRCPHGDAGLDRVTEVGRLGAAGDGEHPAVV